MEVHYSQKQAQLIRGAATNNFNFSNLPIFHYISKVLVEVWYFNFMHTAPESLSTKYHPKHIITQVSTDEPFRIENLFERMLKCYHSLLQLVCKPRLSMNKNFKHRAICVWSQQRTESATYFRHH